MSQAHMAEEVNEGGVLSQTESWIDLLPLNPAIEPWFPCAETGVDFSLHDTSNPNCVSNFFWTYDIPNVSFDPNDFWSYDSHPDTTYLPLTNYYPEPLPQQEQCVVTQAQNDSVSAIREELDQIKVELMQVKQELEDKVQMIAK
jgi:hypothetical protein